MKENGCFRRKTGFTQEKPARFHAFKHTGGLYPQH